MGKQLLDQYSLLHYSSGVVAYFWNIPFSIWFIIHFGFELGENTDQGMKFINSFKLWPGGKPHKDSWLNILGDNVSAMLGWICARQLDDIGTRRKWYVES